MMNQNPVHGVYAILRGSAKYPDLHGKVTFFLDFTFMRAEVVLVIVQIRLKMREAITIRQMQSIPSTQGICRCLWEIMAWPGLNFTRTDFIQRMWWEKRSLSMTWQMTSEASHLEMLERKLPVG